MKNLNLLKGGVLCKMFAYGGALLAMILIFTGCSKKLENEVPELGGSGLTFKVMGVEGAPIVSNKLGATNSSVYLAVENNVVNKQTITSEDVVFDFISEQSANTADFDEVNVGNASSKSKLAATVPMGQAIRYRVLVYTTDATPVCIANVEATVGKAQHVSVTPGKAYKWYAYSYNTSSPIATPDASNPVLTTPTRTPLLYDSGTITANADGTILPVVFKHQLTQLSVQIAMAPTDSLRAVKEISAVFSGNPIKARSFNVLTGQQSGEFTVHDVGALEFTPETVNNRKMAIARGYYTADASYTSFAVKFSSLNIQNTKNTPLDVVSSLPSGGLVTFKTFSGANKGSVLLGRGEISVVLPQITIWAYSNDNNNGAYRLKTGTGARMFLDAAVNFGPGSRFVKTKNPPIITSTIHSSTGGLATMLSNPLNYPDILIIANYHDYINDASFAAVRKYLDAGGHVFYTQDELEGSNSPAERFLTSLFGQTVKTAKPAETSGVYRMNHSAAANADSTILNGVFGDARPYYWGQDRSGTVYMTGYTGTNITVYSTYSENDRPNTLDHGTCFFKHKNKNFFFVGDGGFFANDSGTSSTSNLENPFRIHPANAGATLAFTPIITRYGQAATSTAVSGSKPAGSWDIANSMAFGNVMAWMMDRVSYYGVNRN